jgi:hypothetical protein
MPCCRVVLVGVCCLVPMEQMIENLMLALKEVEAEHPGSESQKILEKAVDQAISLRGKKKAN